MVKKRKKILVSIIISLGDKKQWNEWKIQEVVIQRCSVKKGFLKSFAKSAEKHMPGVFFSRVTGLSPVFLLRRNFIADVFIWILQNFQEDLFCKTFVNFCFWKSCLFGFNWTIIETICWNKFLKHDCFCYIVFIRKY